MTVEQFAAMPDDVNDHHELVEGDLAPVPSATLKNPLLRDNFLFRLKVWSSSHHLATAVSKMDVRTVSKTVRRPDISIFSAEQICRFSMNVVPVPEPPMIAIELLSPSEGMIAIGRKVAEYLSAGSEEVWLIDHENREVQRSDRRRGALAARWEDPRIRAASGFPRFGRRTALCLIPSPAEPGETPPHHPPS